jgi:hypothetical protein
MPSVTDPSAFPTLPVTSTASTIAFVALVLSLVVLLVLAAGRPVRPDEVPARRQRWRRRTTLLALLWLALTGAIPASGVLATRALPPPAFFYVFGCLALAAAAAYSPLGTRLVASVPIAWLVGYQCFRLPLELILHSWYEQGALPVQMTFEGQNLDIISGALALVVGIWAAYGRVPRAVLLGFNLLALGLLLNVSAVAILSTPTPLRIYQNDPPVLLPWSFPHAWIVPWCVGGALFGHLLVFRWLQQPRERGVI